MNHPMTERHANDLREFGEKIGARVCIYKKGTGPLGKMVFDGDIYVTLPDDHATSFPEGVRKLQRLATYIPQETSFLVY